MKDINNYNYFNRDISWLSFNYRVLLESETDSMPIYERIKFLSIHASNLEEFYKVRVSEHRGIIMKKIRSEESTEEAEHILEEITTEVTRQQQKLFSIFRKQIIPELKRQGIMLYLSNEEIANDEHTSFIRQYFNEEIFPFIEPVMIMKDDIRFFIRDGRLYRVVRLTKKDIPDYYYAIIKIPHSKVPRFIELPSYGGKSCYMFVEDIIASNLETVFPGFQLVDSYSVKISRDADIYIDEEQAIGNELAINIIKKVKKRKIGDLSRFVTDRNIPPDFLNYICEAFNIRQEDIVPDNPHLSMEDLIKLPNPKGAELVYEKWQPLHISLLENTNRIFKVIRKQDIFLHYPYHTFDYFIWFLMEAAFDKQVDEIKLTQYRVAENSAVINSLITAAQQGKKVTVFVELKARFDEENNLHTAETMKQAGIRILYSLPGLKVHAKLAFVKEKNLPSGKPGRTYSYLSTGNFNEKTAQLYSDMAIITGNKRLNKEIENVFNVFEAKIHTNFRQLLVAQFNMVPELKRMIRREINHVKKGMKGRIILKMNALQDPYMINELYKASEAGVEIDLIIRGICCLVPDQPYSKNIRIIRIVDRFLEHARIWYFYNAGEENVYLTSADWMKRNLYRRIETAFPVLSPEIKQKIITILQIQLQDNVKACRIDENLNNIFVRNDNPVKVWAQQEIYKLLAKSS
jgi:polyphosphate kinase 1